jgi:transcription initiation factor TFIIIB Brf1 subunit/transcription initiation factor TFIIB
MAVDNIYDGLPRNPTPTQLTPVKKYGFRSGDTWKRVALRVRVLAVLVQLMKVYGIKFPAYVYEVVPEIVANELAPFARKRDYHLKYAAAYTYIALQRIGYEVPLTMIARSIMESPRELSSIVMRLKQWLPNDVPRESYRSIVVKQLSLLHEVLGIPYDVIRKYILAVSRKRVGVQARMPRTVTAAMLYMAMREIGYSHEDAIRRLLDIGLIVKGFVPKFEQEIPRILQMYDLSVKVAR